jgi:uncharacterized membrane protein
MDKNPTSTGLTENVAGLLCYVAWWVTGIIFLIIEKNSRLVRFHAMQSIVFFGGITIINIVLSFIPFIGWALAVVIWIIGIIFWIVLMMKAYRGQKYKLPVVGNIAESLLPKELPKPS